MKDLQGKLIAIGLTAAGVALGMYAFKQFDKMSTTAVTAPVSGSCADGSTAVAGVCADGAAPLAFRGSSKRRRR